MIKNYPIVVDTHTKAKHNSIVVNTNDLKTVKLLITINTAKKPIDLTGKTVRIAIVKPDKKTVFQNCTITDAVNGKCEVILNTQAYAVKGLHVAEMMVYSGTDTVAVTGTFTYSVVGGILSGDTVESQNDWQAINQAIADAEGILIDLRENGTGVDAQARTDITSLNAQMAQKASQDEVSNGLSLKRDKSVPISLNDAGEDLLTAIQGGTTVEVLSIPRDLSVTPEKTTFLFKSTNLFNKNDMQNGYNFDNTTGQPVENASFGLSGFFKVEPNQNYIMKDILKIGRYDANYNFIGTYSVTNTPFSSMNAEYFRAVAYPSKYETAQLNKGDTLLAYEPYAVRLDDEVDVAIKNSSVGTEHLKPDSVSSENLKADSVTAEKAAFIVGSSNLFNPNTIMDGYNFDNTTGQPVADSLYGLSDFIKVNPNTNYSGKNIKKVGRYDASKKLISNYSPSPDNAITFGTYTAEYIRLVIPRDRYKIAQVNIGGSLLPYEPYGNKLDSAIYVQGLKKELDLWEEDRFVIEGITEGTIKSEPLGAIPTHYNTTSFIALYDSLVTSFPDYITKTTLGTDSLGESIYRYDFKPIPVPTNNPSNTKVNTKFPKMILISAVHGEEKAGAYNLYYALKQITEKWQDNELLETLRWNVHFIVLPIVNNYGFNNATRQNENGVDIARNFPEGWEQNTAKQGEPTYGGTAPLTEAGSRLVAQVLDENKDAIYFTSHHSFGTNFSTTEDNYIWNASATKLQVQLGKQFVSKLTRKWRKEYDWMPTDRYLGYADQNSPVGSEGMYAASLGIQASTFETSDALPHETTRYSSLAVTLGAEAFLNWLLINLRENVNFYNSL